MFSDNKKGKGPDLTNQQNRISQGTTLKGDVTSEGGFRIDGVIHGNITSPNKIVIGKTGVVIGTLICNDADVEGKMGGVDEELIENLSNWCSIPVTYAGGVSSYDDIKIVNSIGKGKIDLTIGSALDIFGGDMEYKKTVEIFNGLSV